MDDLSARLAKLGEAVAEVSDRAAPPRVIGAARRRLLSTSTREAGRSRAGLSRWALVAGLAAAGAAALFFFLSAQRPAAMSFDVGSPPAPGVTGDWIAAPDAPLDVRFSEGSSVTLAPGARVRVTEARAEGASVLIERGAVHASIEHGRRDTRWSVRAGPFDVRVTGTVFDAQWDPSTEMFELSMAKGSVTVAGPFLPSERAIFAGERLVVSIREGRMELRTARADLPPAPRGSALAEAAAASSEGAPPAASPELPASAAPSSHAAAPRASAQAAGDLGWRELALGGRYKDALLAAERAGFSVEIGRASHADLLALGDAARLAGSPTRAREALLAARKRFGADGRSAFLLGKIAADQQGAVGEAVTWFETYLRESPGGPLAEQALGRILEIRRREGSASARAVAERYLASYPNGAYATVAKSVLSP